MVPGGTRVEPVAIYLEKTDKRVFACAYDWPGWCRSGKTEELAIDHLASYAARYAAVAREAAVEFSPVSRDTFTVVERLPGSASTDFGVPGEVAASDAEPVDAATAGRLTALVEASWTVFDRVAAGTPAELRKGPRGGGRDRDKMIAHVRDAEAAYARKLGIKQRRADHETVREAIVAVLSAPSDGTPPVPKGWPPRYAARRIAWHALDHAWEMEDRTPQPSQP